MSKILNLGGNYNFFKTLKESTRVSLWLWRSFIRNNRCIHLDMCVYTLTYFYFNHTVATGDITFKACRRLGKMCVGRKDSCLLPWCFPEPKQLLWGLIFITLQPHMQSSSYATNSPPTSSQPKKKTVEKGRNFSPTTLSWVKLSCVWGGGGRTWKTGLLQYKIYSL